MARSLKTASDRDSRGLRAFRVCRHDKGIHCMRKSLVALLLLAASGLAQAQVDLRKGIRTATRWSGRYPVGHLGEIPPPAMEVAGTLARQPADPESPPDLPRRHTQPGLRRWPAAPGAEPWRIARDHQAVAEDPQHADRRGHPDHPAGQDQQLPAGQPHRR